MIQDIDRETDRGPETEALNGKEATGPAIGLGDPRRQAPRGGGGDVLAYRVWRTMQAQCRFGPVTKLRASFLRCRTGLSSANCTSRTYAFAAEAVSSQKQSWGRLCFLRGTAVWERAGGKKRMRAYAPMKRPGQGRNEGRAG